jgi:hypothetical protein
MLGAHWTEESEHEVIVAPEAISMDDGCKMEQDGTGLVKSTERASLGPFL